MFAGEIGHILYTLYSAFFDRIVPMMQSFVEILTAPLQSFADLLDETFIGDLLDILGWFFDLQNTSLLDVMISSAITFYVVFTLFKFFWGSVDFV